MAAPIGVSSSQMPMITRDPAADTGRVTGPGLHFVGHSTVRIDLAGRRVLTDPVLTGRLGPLRRVVPLPDPSVWDRTDLVLVEPPARFAAAVQALGLTTRVLLTEPGQPVLTPVSA